MKSKGFFHFVWVFTSMSVFGFCFEVIIDLIQSGTWEGHQGILYLPMTPVYGFGFVLMVLIGHLIRRYNGWIQYGIAVLIGGGFEWIFSYIEEWLFNSRSWEYSNLFLNIDGRTTIPYAMLWGLMGFGFMRLWPLLEARLDRWITPKSLIVTQVVFWLLIADALFTSLVCWRAYERFHDQAPSNVVEIWIDTYFGDELMEAQYPHMNFK